MVMDDRRFDAFARSLAAGGSRRRMLKLFGGLAVAIGGAPITRHADAARRGYGGPPFPAPTTPPGPCVPFCGVGLCGIPNGCGGSCTCAAASGTCVFGVCAPACESGECEFCLEDGSAQGCFSETSLTCSDDTDCQAQFGTGICRAINGRKVCLIPDNGPV
jgi:hypothetical protein